MPSTSEVCALVDARSAPCSIGTPSNPGPAAAAELLAVEMAALEALVFEVVELEVVAFEALAELPLDELLPQPATSNVAQSSNGAQHPRASMRRER